MSNTHTKSTLRRALTRPYPSSAQLEASPACQGLRAAGLAMGWQGQKGCRSTALGFFTPVPRWYGPRWGWGQLIRAPRLNLFFASLHVRPGLGRPSGTVLSPTPGKVCKDQVPCYLLRLSMEPGVTACMGCS